MQSLSPGWDSRTKRYVLFGGIVLTGLAIWWFAAILPITITAVVLSYLFNPIVTFIEDRVLAVVPLRWTHSRGLAVFFTFVLIIALIAVLILVVVPVMVGQLEEFGRNIPRLLKDVETEVERILSEPLMFNGEPILIGGEPFVPLDRLLEATGTQSISELLHLENIDLMGTAQTFIGSLGSVTGPAFGFLGDAVNVLINFMFLVVMMFYLMKDGEIFAKKLVNVTPELYQDDVRSLLNGLARVWNAYLRGQIVISLMTGTLVFFAAVFLGLRNALILGLFSGILQLIPSIGPFMAAVPAGFLALVSTSVTFPFLQGVSFFVVVVVVWVVIQNFILFVMIPRVMGSNLDLHPFVIIVSVIAGASVAGALGVILSVPFAASARLLVHYVYSKLTDHDPFPDVETNRMPEHPRGWQRLGSFVIKHLPDRVRASLTHSGTVPDLIKIEKE